MERKNDTLYLVNETNLKGISYLIKSKVKTALNYNSWKTFLFTSKNKYEKLSHYTSIRICLI